MAARPLTARRRDLAYVLFLCSYIPTILFFDCLPLYPAALVPAPLTALHGWYVAHYNDQLAANLPALPWFQFFFYTEFFYQLPAALLILRGLVRDDRSVWAHALAWGVWCAGTTATCVYEFVQWRETGEGAMSRGEKQSLVAMFGGYGLIFAVIAGDMFMRIQGALGEKSEKKTQ